MNSILKKLSGFDKNKEMDEEEMLAEEAEEYFKDNEDSLLAIDEEEKKWMQTDYEEGQLSIDVYQTPDTIVVKSTIAGVKPEDIDISINNDLLTIRGRREMMEKIREENYLYRECYWGSFSRSIILPVEVEAEKIEAYLENGVLTVVLPKAKSAKQISIKVKER
ncbi:MAG: Spore protein SP21 [Parcubacteria group bacterium ADurb.Bin316]|nr:MAG: Spore protein SP21 [Parcubacteria group bacterium ADurb.Bin316]HOZ55980.1 Hsp20/alpha crystallin family protein [bacterium]